MVAVLRKILRPWQQFTNYFFVILEDDIMDVYNTEDMI